MSATKSTWIKGTLPQWFSTLVLMALCFFIKNQISSFTENDRMLLQGHLDQEKRISTLEGQNSNRRVAAFNTNHNWITKGN